VFTNGAGETLAIGNRVRIANLPYVGLNHPRATLICDNQSDRGIDDFPQVGDAEHADAVP